MRGANLLARVFAVGVTVCSTSRVFAHPASASRVHGWLREHPRERHGTHRYGLVHYGLDEATVDRRMRSYLETFGEHTNARAAG